MPQRHRIIILGGGLSAIRRLKRTPAEVISCSLPIAPITMDPPRHHPFLIRDLPRTAHSPFFRSFPFLFPTCYCPLHWENSFHVRK